MSDRVLAGRVAFRCPAPCEDPATLIGRGVESITLHGVNLAGPGLVVASATPIDDGAALWIVAERWEVTA